MVAVHSTPCDHATLSLPHQACMCAWVPVSVLRAEPLESLGTRLSHYLAVHTMTRSILASKTHHAGPIRSFYICSAVSWTNHIAASFMSKAIVINLPGIAYMTTAMCINWLSQCKPKILLYIHAGAVFCVRANTASTEQWGQYSNDGDTCWWAIRFSRTAPAGKCTCISVESMLPHCRPYCGERGRERERERERELRRRRQWYSERYNELTMFILDRNQFRAILADSFITLPDSDTVTVLCSRSAIGCCNNPS